jgi:hypothetical protein
MGGDEHPFIDPDAPDPDPMADFKRALELTGERWLSFSEAVALLRDREPISIGQAEAVIDGLHKAHFAGNSTGIRWHWFHDTDFRTNKPNRGNTFLSDADLIYWLDRNRPVPAVQGRAGAPTKHDWPAYEQRFWELWEDKGDFRKPEDRTVGWNSKASAARALVEIIAKGSDGPPDQKTVEDYIGRWLKSRGV